MADVILDLGDLRSLAESRDRPLRDSLDDAAVTKVLAARRRAGLERTLAELDEDGRAAMRKALDRVDPAEFARRPAAEIAREALGRVDLGDAARARLEDLLAREEAADPLGARPGADPGDATLRDVPDLKPELDRAAVAKLSGIAGLRDGAAKRLVASVGSLDALSDQRIGTLVLDDAMSDDEARRLGLVTGMAHVLGGDTAAVERLSREEFRPLRGRVRRLPDILRLDDATLGKTIAPETAERDPEAAAAEARALKIRIEERFPSEGLAVRLSPPPADALRRAYGTVREVIEADPTVLDRAPEGLDPDEASALAAVRETVSAFPGLGLREIAREGAGAQATVARMGERIALFDRFAERNPDVDLLTADFTPGSEDMEKLDFGGLDDADRDGVLGVLKARARTLGVGGSVRVGAGLMKAGLHSSIAIAEMTREEIAESAGIAVAEATLVLESARDTRLGVGTLIGSLADELRWDRDQWVWIGPILEDVTDGLRRLPGYEDLFGDQSHCDCAHCDSILSPAAYFVDLMSFVDEKVTRKEFVGATEDHALKLESRRPDLWTTPLSCDATHDLVPTLEIIGGILETAIARREDAGVDPDDRAAVGAIVYDATLPAAIRSFVTPFDRRVAAADLLLRDFDTDRAEIVELMAPDAPAEARAAAALGHSAAAHAMITTPRPQWAYLTSLYRRAFPRNGGIAEPFDVQDLMAAMEVDRETIGAIVETAFVQGGDAIRIRSQKRSEESVQNDIERVTGMTQGGLDRIHRFLRLTRATGWHPRTLGAVLEVVGGGLTGDAVSRVVAIRRMADRLALDVEEVLALGGPIPTEPMGADEDDPSLMDRLFNGPSAGAGAAPFPAPAIRFVHPALRDDASLPEAGPNAGAFVSQRLRVGLGIPDADLLALIEMLAPALGIDTEAAAEADRGFLLSAEALALLYRHARLAAALRLDVAELSRAVRIATGAGAVTDFAGLAGTVSLVERVGRLPTDLETMAALMGLVDDPVTGGHFVDADEVAAAVAAEIDAAERALFAPTVFAFVEGVSEDQSRAIVAANAALFEPMPRDMLRLAPDVGLAPAVAAPAGGFPAGVDEGDLRAVLDPFNLRALIPAETAAALGIGADKLDEVAAFAGSDLTAQAVVDGVAAGNPDPLRDALAPMARALAAFADDAFTAERVAFVAANPALFALGDPVAPYTRAAALALAGYLEALLGDDGADGYAEAVDAVLAAHAAPGGFAAADTEALARAAGGETATIRVFETGADLPDQAVPALARLRRIVSFAGDRGLSADAMALLSSPEPDALGAGAESLKAALQLRLGDAASFEAALEVHEDALRGRRRDALTDYLIRDSAGRFENRGDLYAYYLIDPDMEGCARTSLVVSAIGSVQTYVHRILLNLEQDRRAADAADHVHVSPTRIPAGEWEWRKNYRVWEANRKVFLWPENYMLPELRDNKTPQFEALEKTLLQQDLTEQTVLDAYAGYLRGFEDVANLKIAGAYHEQIYSQGTDVLHVFGCTADDPPVYHYWTIHNLAFSKLRNDRRISYSARRRIDIAIPVRDVTPFVYNNRLHLFWLEISTNAWNRVEDGNNEFRGYRHTLNVRFSFLKLDGSWSPPQSIALSGRNGLIRDGGIVQDAVFRKNGAAGPTVPHYSDDFSASHLEYQEGYTLRPPAWRQVYPGVRAGVLYLNVGGFLSVYRVDMFERKATEVSSAERDMLDIYWTNRIQAMHVSGGGSQLRIREQTVPHMTATHPGTIGARQNFVAHRRDMNRNAYGMGYAPINLENFQNAIDLENSDLNASIARVNDPDPHVVVPVSDWGLPCALVQKDSDISFFHYSFDWAVRPYEARRLGTTVLDELSRTLFYGGVDALLDKRAQADLSEKSHLVTSSNFRTHVRGTTSGLDYTGPLGVYFRELFFHIPALIASHHNGRGDHAAAQGWYRTIFDPTAKFDADVDLAGLSASARRQAERDRVWQYAEFQGMAPPTLRTILTDDDAQEAYRKDPFNPYAIGRLRLSAFQKNIVMRYCDNLLDWADALFTQFTRESVDEAHVLYDLVRQILGPRPADAGDCGQGGMNPRTYARLAPHMEAGQDFLIEVETWIIGRARLVDRGLGFTTAARQFIEVERADVLTAELKGRVESAVAAEIRFDQSRPPATAARVEAHSLGATERMLGDDRTVARLPDEPASKPAPEPLPEHRAREARFTDAVARDGRPGLQLDWKRTGAVTAERAHSRALGLTGRDPRAWAVLHPGAFTWSLARQISPAFCVPRNKDLLALWDRVEDRLFKIHNCRNIDGERVDLALFAPEIDPMALVRARAAGLSLSDILGASAGNLPPYRFGFLVAKAREYTGLVQGFGAKLQSAMEKRDGEALAKLRLTQAVNMQNLVTKIREKEVKVAQETLEEIRKRKETIEYKKEFYEAKIENDLLPAERAEQVLTHAANVSKVLAAALKGTAGIFYLIPQLGSPFAMKYGGSELGHSAKEWGEVFKDTATMLMIGAKSASLEAKYAKARKEWKHALKLEKHALKEIEKRIKVAEIRVEIAEKALSNHEQAIADQEELLDFYQSKFTGEALYSWMASTLQTIYRQAFNAAFSMARLAEAAYRFERPSDDAQLLELTYWEPGQAGLLSGEKLAVDLVDMEKRYLETNYRTLEITQPFSLSEIDPAALMALRETGSCDVTIPELAFDLLYPGQYRRRIRSVRLSVACVTGPYVNVPVTLNLTGARMRVEPTLDGEAGLVDSLLRHSVQIATSTAQNDSGTFDFSFADPRYMPFEGAGAVDSRWRMTLPSTFRPFDYDTITDVVLHISYTAESDGVLRDRVEADNAALEGTILGVLEDTGLPRAYSLRQEFGTAFHALTQGPVGVDGAVTLDARALPFPLRGRALSLDRAVLLLKPAEGLSATGTRIRVNGVELSGFAATPDFPGYVVTDAAAAFAAGIEGEHAVAVVDAGDLGPGDGAAAMADGALEDMVIFVRMVLD